MNEDLYAILGVSTDAEPAVIRAAYLALVRLHHPDAATSPQEQARAELRTKDLNAAYAVLGDPKRRADYDALRRRPRPSQLRPAAPRTRAVLKPKRAHPRGPSLQDRRERLKRVRLVSVALAVAAVLLIFGAFTGVVGMVRPALPEWLAPKAGQISAPLREPTDPAEVPAEVMLPWPEVLEGRERMMSAAGLSLTFQPVQAGEAPSVVVADARGAKLKVEGGANLSSEQTNLFGIGRLGGADQPAVVVLATPAGQECCLQIRVVYAAARRLQVAELGEAPAAVAERFPSDMNGDGRREWILPDRRFTAAFGPSSPPPPMVFRFEGGRFRDVSAAGEYGEVFANHLAPAQRLCTLGSSGACAAFVASAARLGKAQWGWDIMLRNYGRDRIHDASSSCETPSPQDRAACADEAAAGFPARLRRFLLEAGYVGSLEGLDAEAPVRTP